MLREMVGPPRPVVCVRCTPDLTLTPLTIPHEDAHVALDGAVRIVGAVPSKGLVAVARETPDADAPPNPLHLPEAEPIEQRRGDMLLVATDARGAPRDVDIEAVRALLLTPADSRRT